MELLKEVIKNLNVGVNAIDDIMCNVRDCELKDTICSQKKNMLDLLHRATEELGEHAAEKNGTEPDGFEKVMLKSAVKIKSGFDKSSTNIAEMLIEGNNMGINDVVRVSHRLDGKESTPFVGEMIDLYDANIKELRRFL
ncbi:MAG: hypothetical protein SPI46_05735 [Eubacteriales bacterium]|nr:hypothetical protein [Eubacteriales bacterium]